MFMYRAVREWLVYVINAFIRSHIVFYEFICVSVEELSISMNEWKVCWTQTRAVMFTDMDYELEEDKLWVSFICNQTSLHKITQMTVFSWNLVLKIRGLISFLLLIKATSVTEHYNPSFVRSGIPTVPGTVTLKKDPQNLIGISIGGGAQFCPCLYIVQVTSVNHCHITHF